MEITSITAALPSIPVTNSLHSSSLSSTNSLYFNNNPNLFSKKNSRCSISASTRAGKGGQNKRSYGFNCRSMFGLGVPEIAVVAGVTMLLFGPKMVPELGRSIGQTVKSFQQAAKEFESELKKEAESATETVTEASEASEQKQDANVTGSVDTL